MQKQRGYAAGPLVAPRHAHGHNLLVTCSLENGNEEAVQMTHLSRSQPSGADLVVSCLREWGVTKDALPPRREGAGLQEDFSGKSSISEMNSLLFHEAPFLM